MSDHALPWLSLLVLGAAHGINPAMGWLFAVARGFQERDRRAVWRALGPLALGHALAIAVAVLIVLMLGQTLPMRWLRWIIAAALLMVGVDGLLRHRHVPLGGMRVNARELATWSFVMASVHGAGLTALQTSVGSGRSRWIRYGLQIRRRAVRQSQSLTVGRALETRSRRRSHSRGCAAKVADDRAQLGDPGSPDNLTERSPRRARLLGRLLQHTLGGRRADMLSRG